MHVKTNIFEKFPINSVVKWKWSNETDQEQMNFGVVIGYTKCEESTSEILLKVKMIVEIVDEINSILWLNPYDKNNLLTNVVTGECVYEL